MCALVQVVRGVKSIRAMLDNLNHHKFGDGADDGVLDEPSSKVTPDLSTTSASEQLIE